MRSQAFVKAGKAIRKQLVAFLLIIGLYYGLNDPAFLSSITGQQDIPLPCSLDLIRVSSYGNMVGEQVVSGVIRNVTDTLVTEGSILIVWYNHSDIPLASTTLMVSNLSGKTNYDFFAKFPVHPDFYRYQVFVNEKKTVFNNL